MSQMSTLSSLTITPNMDGSISIAGPIHDKATCYALLELARDAIKEHHDKAAASPIVRPSGIALKVL